MKITESQIRKIIREELQSQSLQERGDEYETTGDQQLSPGVLTPQEVQGALEDLDCNRPLNLPPGTRLIGSQVPQLRSPVGTGNDRISKVVPLMNPDGTLKHIARFENTGHFLTADGYSIDGRSIRKGTWPPQPQ